MTGKEALSCGEPITNEKNAFYLSPYVQYIGPWFDLFDNSDRHFSYVVPTLALNNRLLRLSCLAAAARQYSLVSGSHHGDALLYYDEALRTLSSYLDVHAQGAETFTSCLLVAHCEMRESNADDWNLHLKGTRELIVAEGWHGDSGRLAQACFCIYCRMMILSSMSSGTPTPINTASWLPTGTFTDAPQWTANIWARKTAYLLGSVHNFACRTRWTSDPSMAVATEREWDDLHEHIRHHEKACPQACKPLSVVRQQQFQQIGYTNGTIAAAWQMYHTLVLAHATCAPSSTKERSSTLQSISLATRDHAKLMVANSMSNRFETAWVKVSHGMAFPQRMRDHPGRPSAGYWMENKR